MEMTPIEIEDVAKAQLNGEQLHGRNVEAPKMGSLADGDTIRVVGWVVGRSSRALAVEIVHDGTILQSVPVSVQRSDLVEAFPEVPGAEQSGFRTNVAIPNSPEFELLVQAVLHDESRVPLSTIRARQPRGGEEPYEVQYEEQYPESNDPGQPGPLTRFFRQLLGRGDG
jgi:hypothetical protein